MRQAKAFAKKRGYWVWMLVLAGLILVPSRLAHTADDLDDLELSEATPKNGDDAKTAPAKGGEDSLNDLETVMKEDGDKPATGPAQAQGTSSAKNDVKPSGSDDDLTDLGGDTAAAPTPVNPQPNSDEKKDAKNQLEMAKGGDKKPTDPNAPALPDTDGETPKAIGDPSVRNTITNLEFKMEGAESRIVVSARHPLAFREVRNSQMKQIVYFFENTETPNRIQRAYDTTEFSSPVALFTLLQMPNDNPPLSKLIVQLRDEKYPKLIPSQRGLYIDFPASAGGGEPKLILGEKDANASTEENIYATGQSYSGKQIKRLEVKNSDVNDVLRLIAKSSGYNIVVGDDVTGKVGMLSLENVPWDQAFTLVLQSKKLGYIKTGNVIRVATLAELKNEKDEALASEQSRIKVETLRTVLIPVSYAKAADLAGRGKNFLTERGNIDVDARTNTIIVRDIDVVVNRIQKLFAALDTQPPRVSISAKIVEVGRKLSRALGFSTLNMTGNLGGFNLNYLQSNQNFGEVMSTTITAPSFANLNYILSIGEVDEKTKVLANPSVSAVNGQLAKITQSLNFFVTTNTVSNGVITPTVQEITANLTLEVTPIVAGDGSIFLTIHAQNDIPTGVGTQSPTIDGREVNTQVLIENGDTAVIGGVFKNTVDTSRTGLPFIKDIPIIGFFFSRDTVEDDRNEIYIFITAKVTNAEDAFKRAF